MVPLATLTGDSPAPGLLPDHPTGTAVLHPVDARRIACDAQVARLVLSPDGVPQDLGRTVRVFTAHQSRALAARDDGCRFPGCDRPACYADAHHLVHWADGGPTVLTNGYLLCRFHHRLVHREWSAAPDDPQRGANCRLWFTDPLGRRYASDPRGP